MCVCVSSQVINGIVRWSRAEGAMGGSPSTAALCVPCEEQQLQCCSTAELLCIHLSPTQRHAGKGKTSTFNASCHGLCLPLGRWGSEVKTLRWGTQQLEVSKRIYSEEVIHQPHCLISMMSSLELRRYISSINWKPVHSACLWCVSTSASEVLLKKCAIDPPYHHHHHPLKRIDYYWCPQKRSSVNVSDVSYKYLVFIRWGLKLKQGRTERLSN